MHVQGLKIGLGLGFRGSGIQIVDGTPDSLTWHRVFKFDYEIPHQYLRRWHSRKKTMSVDDVVNIWLSFSFLLVKSGLLTKNLDLLR